MEGKKRKATKKQLQNLAKGRKALAAKRKGHFMGGIDGIDGRKKGGKPKGKRTVVVVAEGAKKRRRSRRHISLMGELGASARPKQIQAAGIHVATSLAGAVIGSILVSRMPIKDPKIQALIPLAAGILGTTMARQVAIQRLSEGIAIGAGLALLKAVAPQLKLAGEDGENLVIPEELRREISAMGAIEQSGQDEYQGAIEQSGQDEYQGAIEQSGDLETETETQGEDFDGDDEVYTGGYLTQANL